MFFVAADGCSLIIVIVVVVVMMMMMMMLLHYDVIIYYYGIIIPHTHAHNGMERIFIGGKKLHKYIKKNKLEEK